MADFVSIFQPYIGIRDPYHKGPSSDYKQASIYLQGCRHLGDTPHHAGAPGDPWTLGARWHRVTDLLSGRSGSTPLRQMGNLLRP